MSTDTSAVGRCQELPGGVAGHVLERLGRYRADLYGGRGPGISEAEWLRNTSLRPAVAPGRLARALGWPAADRPWVHGLRRSRRVAGR